MNLSDISRHISKNLHEKIGLKIYVEDINKITRPCIFLKNINSSKEFKGQSVEKLTASFDIIYFPSQANGSCNEEIQDKLDAINQAFDNNAYKTIQVFDRSIVLNDVSTNIVDNVGHYIIDLSLMISFGEREKYDVMRKIELKLEN